MLATELLFLFNNPPSAWSPTPPTSSPAPPTLTYTLPPCLPPHSPSSLTPAALCLATPLAWWRWTPPCCRSPGSSPCSWGSPSPAPSRGRGSWMPTPPPRSPRRRLWEWSSGSAFCRTSCKSTVRHIYSPLIFFCFFSTRKICENWIRLLIAVHARNGGGDAVPNMLRDISVSVWKKKSKSYLCLFATTAHTTRITAMATITKMITSQSGRRGK